MPLTQRPPWPYHTQCRHRSQTQHRPEQLLNPRPGFTSFLSPRVPSQAPIPGKALLLASAFFVTWSRVSRGASQPRPGRGSSLEPPVTPEQALRCPRVEMGRSPLALGPGPSCPPRGRQTSRPFLMARVSPVSPARLLLGCGPADRCGLSPGAEPAGRWWSPRKKVAEWAPRRRGVDTWVEAP